VLQSNLGHRAKRSAATSRWPRNTPQQSEQRPGPSVPAAPAIGYPCASMSARRRERRVPKGLRPNRAAYGRLPPAALECCPSGRPCPRLPGLDTRPCQVKLPRNEHSHRSVLVVRLRRRADPVPAARTADPVEEARRETGRRRSRDPGTGSLSWHEAFLAHTPVDTEQGPRQPWPSRWGGHPPHRAPPAGQSLAQQTAAR
jgi:hypothetical protein